MQIESIADLAKGHIQLWIIKGEYQPGQQLKEAEIAMRLKAAKRDMRDREVAYFENNIERMRYADFRARGLFIGSGVVEAGCKSLVGQRLKRSGM